MANEINDMLWASTARWTEEELFEWFKDRTTKSQDHILKLLKAQEKKGRQTLHVLHDIRNLVEPKAPPKQRWTEAELAEWLMNEPEHIRLEIMPQLIEARAAGLDMYSLMSKLRAIVEEKQSCTIFEAAQAAWAGYSEGSIAADLPSAIRNLSNMK